jgi:hypothetical protein
VDAPEDIPAIEIVVPPEWQTGVYANYATVSTQSPHDFTLDFIQVIPGDPAGAVVVARVKISPSFLMPLLQALAKHQTMFEEQMRRIQEHQEGDETP